MSSYNLEAINSVIPDNVWLGPLEATIGGMALIFFFIAIHCLLYNHYQVQENDEHIKYSILYKISRYFLHRSWAVLCISVPVAILMCVNQLAYIKENIKFNGDINYYLRVSSKQFERIETITTAAAFTSYKNLVGNSLFHSRRDRRLISSYSSEFIIVYHASDWSNILTSQAIQDICNTEALIVASIDCLDFSSLSTAITKLTSYPDCSSITRDFHSFSSDEIASYFQDDFVVMNPISSIMMSYAQVGTCSSSDTRDLFNQLNKNTVNDIKVNFVDQNFLDKELYSSTSDAAYYLVVSVIFATITLAVWLRGILCSIATVLSIIVSIFISTGLLPIFGFETFSIVNGISVFLLYGVGVNTVLMFHSSWRRSNKAGFPATADTLLESYLAVGGPFLYLLFIACVTLFVISTSPVIIVKQLGSFLGISIIVFYLEFHYIFLPVWIITSKFLWPTTAHDDIDHMVRTLSFGLLFWNHDEETVDQHAPAAIAEPPPSVNVHSIDMLETIPVDDEHYHEVERSSGLSSDEWRSGAALIAVADSNPGTPVSSPQSSPRYLPRLRGNSTSQDRLSSNVPSSHGRQSSDAEEINSSPRAYSNSVTESIVSLLSPRSNNESVVDDPSPRMHSLSIADSVAEPVYESSRSNVNAEPSSPRREAPVSPRASSIPEESPRAAPLLHLEEGSIDLDSLGNPVYRRKSNSKKKVGLVYCHRIVIVTLIICAFLVVFYATYNKFSFDIGIPKLLSPDTNIGQSLTIINDYKPSLLKLTEPVIPLNPTNSPTSYPTSSGPTSFPTMSPSSYPTVYPSRRPSQSPSMRPTNNPSSIPSITLSPTHLNPPSYDPTISFIPTSIPSAMPTTRSPSGHPSSKPTAAPSRRPTLSPRSNPTLRPTSIPSNTPSPTPTAFLGLTNTDYMVSCCFGISYSVPKIDSEPQIEYDQVSFIQYSSNKTAFFSDVKSFCSYVNDHRGELNVHPNWNFQRDCLYQQLIDAANSTAFKSIEPIDSPTYMSSLLLYWASRSSSSSNLLGVGDSTESSLLYEPMWVCMNFSTQSNITDLRRDSRVVSTQASLWDEAFVNYGGVNAKMNGVAMTVGSSSFSVADTYASTTASIYLAALCGAVGVFGLLLVFTRDPRQSLVAAIIIILIFAVTAAINITFSESKIDLIDVILLIISFSVVVNFPVYMILDYRHEKDLGVASASRRFGLSVSPTVSASSFYMRHALLGPVVMTVVLCIPLLFLVSQMFIKKFAIYVIVLMVVSYIITTTLFPPLIAMASGFECLASVVKISGLEDEEWYRTSRTNENSQLNSQSLMPMRQASLNLRNSSHHRVSTPRESVYDFPPGTTPPGSPTSTRPRRSVGDLSSSGHGNQSQSGPNEEVDEYNNVVARFNEFTLTTPRYQRRSENLRQFLVHDSDMESSEDMPISQQQQDEYDTQRRARVRDLTVRDDSWRNRDELQEINHRSHRINSTTTEMIPISGFTITQTIASYNSVDAEVISSALLGLNEDGDIPASRPIEDRPVITSNLSLFHPDSTSANQAKYNVPREKTGKADRRMMERDVFVPTQYSIDEQSFESEEMTVSNGMMDDEEEEGENETGYDDTDGLMDGYSDDPNDPHDIQDSHDDLDEHHEEYDYNEVMEIPPEEDEVDILENPSDEAIDIDQNNHNWMDSTVDSLNYATNIAANAANEWMQNTATTLTNSSTLFSVSLSPSNIFSFSQGDQVEKDNVLEVKDEMNSMDDRPSTRPRKQSVERIVSWGEDDYAQLADSRIEMLAEQFAEEELQK